MAQTQFSRVNEKVPEMGEHGRGDSPLGSLEYRFVSFTQHN